VGWLKWQALMMARGMMMRIPFIAANWKMNGSLALLREWSTAMLEGIQAPLDTIDWFLFPPSVYVAETQSLLENSPVRWGVQCVSTYSSGAYTGETGLEMISEFGSTAVLIGHSERRSLFGLSNEQVAIKLRNVLKAGLTPVLCVGESLLQREAGLTLQIIQEQLAVALSLHDNPDNLDRLVVAYEPIWAIGTGRTATPEQAQEVHAFLRSQLEVIKSGLGSVVRIIYGGSVNPDNAEALFSMPDIDGGLVGGASLHSDKFLNIGKAWNNS
jgi:triosephosphate isomerase (TIM)